MYNREHFARRVLIEIGVLAADEAPSAEDGALVDEVTQQVFDGLQHDGLIPFDIDGEIPAKYMTPLVRVVAAAAYPSWGVSSRAAMLEANGRTGRNTLHALRQPHYVGEVVRTDYF